MDSYIFRGNHISGSGAYVLLNSVKRVLAECPNPTSKDIDALSEIVKDFEMKMEEDLKKNINNTLILITIEISK